MIVLHHLAYSRGTRILWLLEELKLDYELKRYERDERFKAPAALGAVHPLGKSPVIVDGSLVLGESAVILRYLNERYGGDRYAPPAGSDDYFRHEEWLQYVESTAAPPIMTARIGAVTGGLPDKMREFFAPVLARTLDHIGAAVRRHGYLTGPELMLADIQIVYLLEVAERTGLLAEHPEIRTYVARLKEREAYRKAIEVGGPMMPG
jgi:glutathione S-transferase